MTRKYFLLVFVCFIFFSIKSVLFAKRMHPYRISANIIEDNENKDSIDAEIVFKNTNKNDIKSFNVVLFVSVYAEDNEDSGCDYYEGFEYYDDFAEYEEYGGVNSNSAIFKFVFSVEEGVGGNDEGIFVYPLDFSTQSFSYDYVDVRYEIDFIFASQIVYDNGEMWIYN